MPPVLPYPLQKVVKNIASTWNKASTKQKIIVGAVGAYLLWRGAQLLFSPSQGGKAAIDPRLPMPKHWVGIGDNAREIKFTSRDAGILASYIHGHFADLRADDSPVLAALQRLNGNALRMVYNAFGLRSYGLGGSLPVLGYDYDLFGWFTLELDNEDLNQMRDLWAKSNLPTTF